MKVASFLILFAFLGITSCREDDKVIDAVARVNDRYLYREDLEKAFPANLSLEDSILYRNNFIKSWATKELLLAKARMNVEDTDGEIRQLVENYEKELLIDRYKKALLQQELDTMITEEDVDAYYEMNKNIYRLNEDLIRLKYVHFSPDLSNRKELEKLFRSEETEDRDKLVERELEFNSFTFNDSIWVSLADAVEKLPFLKEQENLKKDQFLQKEDSIGVYLVAVKDILRRNEVAPRSYVAPTIRHMILHNRKLELMNQIENSLVIDAINNEQFEQY